MKIYKIHILGIKNFIDFNLLLFKHNFFFKITIFLVKLYSISIYIT